MLLSSGYWPVTVSGLSRISCFTESMIECFTVKRDDKKMMTVPRFVMFVFNYREQVSLEGNVTDQEQIGNQ